MSYTKDTRYKYPYGVYIDHGNTGLVQQDGGSYDAGGILHGDYNPSWRSQVRQGTNASTAASGDMVDISPGFIDFYGAIEDNNYTQVVYYQVTGIPDLVGFRSVDLPVPDSVMTEVTNRCIRKFLDAADEARSSIEFGQDLGEWKETMHALISPVKSLREFTFSHLSKVLKLTKKVKHKAALSKMVADTWLEFKFGWAPLASDIGQAYADFTNNRNHQDVKPIRASATGTFTCFEDAPFGWYDFSNGHMTVRIRVTGSYSVRMKGAIKTGAKDGRIGTQQMLQLDLPHFVPTIWDLLPYSWIADYFINVGECIRSLCFDYNNLAWGNKTVRTKYSYEYFWGVEFVVPNQFWHVKFTDMSAVNPTGNVVHFERSFIGTADLIPEVRISLPLGSEKPWENLAALFTSFQRDVSRVARHLR